MESGFYLALGMLLLYGSAATVSQDCPGEVASFKCDALKRVSGEIKDIEWDVIVSGSGYQLASCNGILRCKVLKQESNKAHGLKVLSITNGTLSIRRSSWKLASQSVTFRCKVTTRNPHSANWSFVEVDLSVECIWTRVRANVNVTSHLVNFLPWKLVKEVELFDPRAARNSIAPLLCKTHRGCRLLTENLGPGSTVGNRLQENQGSILLSPIQESDEGLEMEVKVQYVASLETCGKMIGHDVPRRFTLRIRLKPDKGPSTTTRLPLPTQAAKNVLNNLPAGKLASGSLGKAFELIAKESAARKKTGEMNMRVHGGRGIETKFRRTKQLVAQILMMSKELNQLVNDVDKVTTTARTN